MTCIVGLVHEGAVWIGGDSAGVAGLSLTVRKDAKVFRNGEFLIGVSASFRVGQLLHHAFTPPPLGEGADIERYMVTGFVDAVRECLKAGGHAERDNDNESGGNFLVGVRGRLFRIEEDYQVAETHLPFTAIGCGRDLAKGALLALRLVGSAKSPRDQVEIALQVAEQQSVGVRGPYTIEHLEKAE